VARVCVAADDGGQQSSSWAFASVDGHDANPEAVTDGLECGVAHRHDRGQGGLDVRVEPPIGAGKFARNDQLADDWSVEGPLHFDDLDRSAPMDVRRESRFFVVPNFCGFALGEVHGVDTARLRAPAIPSRAPIGTST
jgi:hypothetical protein